MTSSLRPHPAPQISRQMEERRQRILRAARGIVAERGYEALTMRELAQASRVTVPTLYNLIGGKHAVLTAAVEEQTARFVSRIEHRTAQSPATRLLSVIEACTHELLGLPAYYRSLLQLLYRAEAANQVRSRVDRALGAELSGALAAIAEAGEFVVWAEPRALLRSLRSQLGANALHWADGELSDAAFPATARYDACLTLLGVTTGRSHAQLTRSAREAQAVRTERRTSSRPRRKPASAGAQRAERAKEEVGRKPAVRPARSERSDAPPPGLAASPRARSERRRKS